METTIKSNMPSISVIITAYNRRLYLLQCIKSVINQTLDKSRYEIIVVKNFKDKTIDDFMEKNGVKSIFYNTVDPKTGGIGQGVFYQQAIEQSNGEILCFLDDDDYFVKDKLEKVYEIFNTNKKVVYYHNRPIFINENGHRIKKSRKSPDYNSSSISIRKKIINLEKLVQVETAPDTFFYLSAVEYGGKILIKNDPLTVVRIHTSLTNISSEEESISWIPIALKHYYKFLDMFDSAEAKQYVKSIIFSFSIASFSITPNQKPRYFCDFIFSKRSEKISLTIKFLLIFLFGKNAKKIVSKRYLHH